MLKSTTLLVTIVALIASYSLEVSAQTPPANSQLNIHLDVPQTGQSQAYNEALTTNACVSKYCSENGVNLQSVDLPHISLYLTAFQPNATKDVLSAIDALVPLLATVDNCIAAEPNASATGTFAMWAVTNNKCLQYLSDVIVNATYMYIVPNQPIPGWVNALPEPTRSEKIALIKKYGSPNVFSQFQPHITLAAVPANSTQSLGTCLSDCAPHPVPSSFTVNSLSVSPASTYGTVPRHTTMQSWPVGSGDEQAKTHGGVEIIQK